MRILITVDPEIPVPPNNYGGIERIVDGLLEGYVKAGHAVALVAHPHSSSTWPEKKYGWPAGQSRGGRNILKNIMFLWRCVSDFQPDVIHSFSRLLYLYPVFAFKKCRVLQTYQRKISPRSTVWAWRLAGKKLRFTACGGHMLKQLPGKLPFDVVPNFTGADHTPQEWEEGQEKYLLFLGRIEAIKGAKEAIDIALASGEKLVIAGNVEPEHQAYFDAEVAPFLDGNQIRYVGPVNDAQKKELWAQTKAFLFPIDWEEPFGIVMVEAMMAGVPVIALNRGAVPEVIEPGQTGVICTQVEKMISAVQELNQKPFSPEKIRTRARERFSKEVVGKQYLELLKGGK